MTAAPSPPTDGPRDGQEAAFLAAIRLLSPRERRALWESLDALAAGLPIKETAISFYVACGMSRQAAAEQAGRVLAKVKDGPPPGWRDALN